MTKLATVIYHRSGYRLQIVEVPSWAYAVERAGEWVCHHTGSVLCAAGLPGWAWKVGVGSRDGDGWPRWNIGSALFSFGQWFHTIASRRERDLYSAALSTEEVAAHFPDKRIAFLEEA